MIKCFLLHFATSKTHSFHGYSFGNRSFIPLLQHKTTQHPFYFNYLFLHYSNINNNRSVLRIECFLLIISFISWNREIFSIFCNIHHFLFFCFRFALLKCFLLYFATYKIHLFYFKSFSFASSTLSFLSFSFFFVHFFLFSSLLFYFSFALLLFSIRCKRIIYVAILLLFMSCFLGDCLLFSTLSFVFRNGRLFLLSTFSFFATLYSFLPFRSFQRYALLYFFLSLFLRKTKLTFS